MANLSLGKSWVWIATLIVTILMVIGAVLGVACRSGTVSYCNYKRINDGMTLDEVERILGPGQAIQGPPIGGGKPVVVGESFYLWRQGYDEIIVAFKDGKVC